MCSGTHVYTLHPTYNAGREDSDLLPDHEGARVSRPLALPEEPRLTRLDLKFDKVGGNLVWDKDRLPYYFCLAFSPLVIVLTSFLSVQT